MAPRTLAPGLRAGLELRCAALVLSSLNGGLFNENVPPRRIDIGLLDGGPRPANSAGPIETQTFIGWLDEASSPNSSPTSRRRAAQLATTDARGQYPPDMDRLGRSTQSGSDFTDPRQWLAVEWDIAWATATNQLVNCWEEALSKVLASRTGSTYIVVGRLNTASGRSHDQASVDAVLSVLKAVPVTPAIVETIAQRLQHKDNDNPADHTFDIVIAPSIVVAWLKAIIFGTPAFTWELGPAHTDDHPQLVETALSLYGEHPGGFDRIDDAFAVARQALQ
jgi:hypothetical protein